jgi:uncharacterized protein (TIGR03084 family)
VADQIGHLTYFDATAAQAITSPDEFKESVAALLAADSGGIDGTLAAFRSMSPAEQLDAWRTNRQLLADAAATLENDTRVPWYGPSMGSKSFLTARLMEAWAHGQDIIDTVGASRPASDRLRHIAQLGFITRGWTYANRKSDMPQSEICVTLTPPGGGEPWVYGTPDANQTVTGSGEDFCLVVTQRRHVADTALVVTGADARDWLEKAQAFAGGPTDGPAAGTFA